MTQARLPGFPLLPNLSPSQMDVSVALRPFILSCEYVPVLSSRSSNTPVKGNLSLVTLIQEVPPYVLLLFLLL